MDYYLIDFENVHSAEVAAMKPLAADDRVLLFYSSPCSKLDLDAVGHLLSQGGLMRPIRAVTGEKNALDFQLTSELGRLIAAHGARCNYRIVSNDRGYDCLASYWAAQSIQVKRVAPRAANSKCAKSRTAPAVTKLMKDDKPAEVERILATVHGKTAVNNALCQLYHDGKHAGRVYSIIKDCIVS